MTLCARACFVVSTTHRVAACILCASSVGSGLGSVGGEEFWVSTRIHGTLCILVFFMRARLLILCQGTQSATVATLSHMFMYSGANATILVPPLQKMFSSNPLRGALTVLFPCATIVGSCFFLAAFFAQLRISRREPESTSKKSVEWRQSGSFGM